MRIGLEPRWYIGGYALLLEELIGKVLEARWPKGRFGGQMPGASERGAEIGAIIKAALPDMDYAISVYLEASESARLKAEAQARAIEQANGIDEMSQTVTHMDEITQHNATLAEESAASARTLLDQTEQLNRLVSAFTTQGDTAIVRLQRRAA